MTLTMTFTPEKETRLQQQASRAGLPLEDYLVWLAEHFEDIAWEQAESIDEDTRGTARIGETRIKVSQIALERTHLNLTPEQINEAHPHLTLAQIYTALAFYYRRKEEIDAQIDASLANADRLREEAGQSPFAARMRAVGKLPVKGRAA